MRRFLILFGLVLLLSSLTAYQGVDFIRDNEIAGVVLLSGDSHIGELNVIPWSERGGYDLYDPIKVGFVANGTAAEKAGTRYDTSERASDRSPDHRRPAGSRPPWRHG